MSNTKKLGCKWLTAAMAMGLFTSIGMTAYAADVQKNPTLEDAPVIILPQETGDEYHTKVEISWKNTEEIINLTLDEVICDGKYMIEEYGYDDASPIYYAIQFAYSMDGGAHWINAHNRDNEYFLDYMLPDRIITDDIEVELPTFWVYGDHFGQTGTLMNLEYYDIDHEYKNESDIKAAYLTQNKAHYVKTENDSYDFYTVDLFGDDKMLIKARYMIYGEYLENDEWIIWDSYSPWSSVFSYGLDVTYENSDFIPGGNFKAPELQIVDIEGNGEEVLLNLDADEALRTFIAQFHALDVEERCALYGEGSQYINWYYEIKVNDGAWFDVIDTDINDHNDWMFVDWWVTDFLEEHGITLQPEDVISIRAHMLPLTQCDEVEVPSVNRGYRKIPTDNCFAYTDYTNTVTYSPSGVYSIGYYTNNGGFEVGTEQVGSYTEDDNFVIDLTDENYIPSKEGYDFGGWYTTNDFKSGTEITSIDLSVKKYYAIYAKWIADEYTVAYRNTYYAVNPNPTIYTAGIPAANLVLMSLEIEGAVFEGWYESADFTGTPVTAINPAAKRNLILYAKWSFPEYRITYSLDGGVNSADNKDKYRLNISGVDASLKAPTKKGWIFTGWFYDDKFTSELSYNNGTDTYDLNASGDVTVYARWIEGSAPISYVNVLDGSKTDTYFYNDNATRYEYGTEIKLHDLSATGYVFGGWFTDEKCTAKATGISKQDTGAKTFYAKWTENTYTIKYVLNQDSKNSPAPSTVRNANPEIRKYSVTIKLLAPACSDSNYTFDGWYTNSNLTGTKIEEISGTRECTLYAKWNVKGDKKHPFIDIIGHFAEKHIAILYERKIMTGDANGITFRPNDAITRGEVVTMLYKMEGRPTVTVTSKPFPDVELGKYYTKPILWAKQNGVAGGYSTGLFGCEDNITRQDFIKMLYSYVSKYKGLDVSVSSPTAYMVKADYKSVSSYAVKHVNWAYEKQFIGKNNALLNPLGYITRGEVATMVSRFLTAYNL